MCQNHLLYSASDTISKGNCSPGGNPLDKKKRHFPMAELFRVTAKIMGFESISTAHQLWRSIYLNSLGSVASSVKWK